MVCLSGSGASDEGKNTRRGLPLDGASARHGDVSGDYLADLRIRVEPGPGAVASLKGVLLVVPSIDPGQEEALDALLSAATTRPVVRGVARVVADFDTEHLPAFCLVVEAEKGGLFALVHGDVVLEACGGVDGGTTRLSGRDAHSWVDRTLPAGLTRLSVRDGSADGRLVLEATSASVSFEAPVSTEPHTPVPTDSGRAVIAAPAPSAAHSRADGTSAPGFRPEPVRFGEGGRMETVAPQPVAVNGFHDATPKVFEEDRGAEPEASDLDGPDDLEKAPATAVVTTRLDDADADDPAAKEPVDRFEEDEEDSEDDHRVESFATPPPPPPVPPASSAPPAPPLPTASPRLSSGLPVRRPQATIPPQQPPTQVVAPPRPGSFSGAVPPPVPAAFDPFGAAAPRPPAADLMREPQAPPRVRLGKLIMDDGPDIVVDADCVIGRNPEVDLDVAQGRAKPVILPDAEQRISRVHARLVYSDAGVEIVDAGSVNGTWIEPPGGAGWIAMVPRVPAPLPLGSRIQVGDLVLSYSAIEEAH